MNYRYRMHWFNDPEAPLNAGRPLIGRDATEAIARAEDLWKEGAYAAALGYLVVDTDEGAVIWRRRRDQGSDALWGGSPTLAGMPRLSACEP